MRQERTIQANIFDLFAGHEIGCELKAMSGWLDENPALAALVAKDLRRLGVKDGRACRRNRYFAARFSSSTAS